MNSVQLVILDLNLIRNVATIYMCNSQFYRITNNIITRIILRKTLKP